MDFLEFLKAQRAQMEERGGARKGREGEEGGGGHVPKALRDPVIVLAPQEVNTKPGIPTVFIGRIQEKYTDEMWDDCVQRMRELFNIKESSYIEMKVLANKDPTKALDLESLSEGIKRALRFVNRENFKQVRVAFIGLGTHKLMFDAIEGLIQGWTQDLNNKNVQIVTGGDSKNRTHLDFCKWLCLKGRCNSVQFYNTTDYTLFGLVDHDNRRKELVRGYQPGAGDLAALLQGLLSDD